MPEITSVEVQKNNKKRCSIFLDGRFYCGLDIETAVKYRLKAGMHAERELLDEIQLEAEKNSALDKALTHISATMKTRKHISDFLVRKGYTQAVIDYVIEKMSGYGFIDDLSYCKAYINSCRGKGKRLIEVELVKRGADRAAIDEALLDMEDSQDDAKAAAAKYLRGKPRSRENIAKAVRYLVSRGYDYETAKSAAEFEDEID